jgi:hypothetical protein
MCMHQIFNFENDVKQNAVVVLNFWFLICTFMSYYFSNMTTTHIFVVVVVFVVFESNKIKIKYLF